jgi:hypothetical protein
MSKEWDEWASRTAEELAQRVLVLTERVENLEDAIFQIEQWCEAYPEDVFTPLSDFDVTRAGLLLKSGNIDVGALHAQWARHLLGGISKIAQSTRVGEHEQGEEP